MTEEEYMIKIGWIDTGRRMRRVIVDVYSDTPNSDFSCVKVGDKYHLSFNGIVPIDELGLLDCFKEWNKDWSKTGKIEINAEGYNGYICVKPSNAYRLIMSMEYDPKEYKIKGGHIEKVGKKNHCLINRTFPNREAFLDFIKFNISPHPYLDYDMRVSSFKEYDNDKLKGFFRVN